jgi:hypothetical protein
VRGSLPTTSITSISPHSGQPTASMSVPSIQNAGHTPWPAGTRMRASTRPWRTVTAPFVINRAEVIVPSGSCRAVTASRPLPSSAAFPARYA